EIFNRNRRLVLLLLCILLATVIIYFLRTVVIPFAFRLVLAYLLLPIITWIEERLPGHGKALQSKRITLIILIYIITIALIGLLSYFIVRTIINAFVVVIPNTPQFISAGLLTLRQFIDVFRQQFPPEMQQQLDTLILNAGAAVGTAIRDMFMRGMVYIPNAFGLIFGFISLPIFVFYILKDAEKLAHNYYSALSPWVAEYSRQIFSIIESVLVNYIRVQLVLGFVVGYLCFVGLLILKANFAFALAAIAEMTELTPMLGPWIGGSIAVLVTLALTPEKTIWVALLFLFVQLLENSLLVPRIQGAYLRIHPAILLFLIIFAGYVAGFWGIVLVAPLSATIFEIYKYTRSTMKMDEIQKQLEI
ncbi:AI-2E family transporter, partial [Chloroflexota bacterium]